MSGGRAAGELCLALDEAACVEAIRAGDVAAFEALFQAYHAALRDVSRKAPTPPRTS